MPKLLAAIVLLLLLFIPSVVNARTTPEDILNSERGAYQQTISKYSTTHQQQLQQLSTDINALNKKITDELELNIDRQGQILDEYARRHGRLDSLTNASRPSSDPLDNARYWLTYAHEAIAYQAAHVYIFNLTGEANIRSDANRLISNLQSDLDVLVPKVEKSRQLIAHLVD